MSRTRIFLSFDPENDADLATRLRDQACRPGSSFEIAPQTREGSASEAAVRSEIESADEVVVICGAHTHESSRVASDLSIAQAVSTPYLLLWGRREVMCKKPVGTRPDDVMYSWTREILEDRIAWILRNEKGVAIPESCKRVRA